MRGYDIDRPFRAVGLAVPRGDEPATALNAQFTRLRSHAQRSIPTSRPLPPFPRRTSTAPRER